MMNSTAARHWALKNEPLINKNNVALSKLCSTWTMITDKALAVDDILIFNFYNGTKSGAVLSSKYSQEWLWMNLRGFDMCSWGGSVEKTLIFTDLNIFQACRDAVVTMTIDSSATASLHCFFILSLSADWLTDWLTTGCFPGSRWRRSGADLRSRSVSWHGKSHSECCEWPPSDPGGETWHRRHREGYVYIRESSALTHIYVVVYK